MRTFEEMTNMVRAELIVGLKQTTESQQLLFKRMYAGPGNRAPNQDELELPIETVVMRMPWDKIEWAFQQVQRTLDAKA